MEFDGLLDSYQTLQVDYNILMGKYLDLLNEHIILQQKYITFQQKYLTTFAPRNPEDAYREDFQNRSN